METKTALEELNERYKIASKKMISSKDISALFFCAESKARKIKAKAIKEFKGEVRFNDHLVLTQSVFELAGIDRDQFLSELAGDIQRLSLQ